MKPTQEQVIAWAQELGWVGLSSEFVSAVTLAYIAGRKDENEACAQLVNSFVATGPVAEVQQRHNWAYMNACDAIRARGNHD